MRQIFLDRDEELSGVGESFQIEDLADWRDCRKQTSVSHVPRQMIRYAFHLDFLEIGVVLGYFAIDVLKLMIDGFEGFEVGFF